MLEIAFTLILAGCGDGDGACTVLSRQSVTAPSLAACEVVLDRALAGMTDAWPEYAGLCQPVAAGLSLPDGWSDPETMVASR